MAPRNSFTAPDLGMQKHFDDRNLNYLIADHLSENVSDAKKIGILSTRTRTATLGEAPASTSDLVARVDSAIRTYKHHWRHPWAGDQGNTPRCTAFSGTKVFLAGPVTHRAKQLSPLLLKLSITENNFDALADLLYQTAQTVDREEGRYYDEGATMLALAKAGVRLGLWKSYYWGYSLTDYLTAIIKYPVLCGIWWRTGMDNPDRKHGVIRYMGSYRGGHSIASDGVNIGDGFAEFDQTWSRQWGVNGHCKMPLEDFERMIADDGELLVVVE
jgi:hypothetical protein